MQGLTIPDTPIEYVKLYTECWDDNPNNRPSIQEAVERLNTINLKSIEVSSRGELSRMIIGFNNMNTKEIIEPMISTSNQIIIQNILHKHKVKDHNKAFNLFTNVSERGHILAQHFVGRCYFYGCGTTKNVKLAFQYFERTANSNLAASQCIIGYCYSNGAGIKKDLKIAFHWYEKAAGNGNIIAMYNLGYSYKKGIGVEKDVNKAIYWYRKSAEQGYEYAQNEIEKLTKKK
ncbi:uncharacterized protein OCT59_024452 [Rhizophagus irregularis]|uniref:uncharacterized protein n=1 Tax=Rhizophagus irregularis TaxID=588596 RepID=UPI0033310BA5|nr:hypothetical protein OCT59_024452 [Rhizophagus irregularis]